MRYLKTIFARIGSSLPVDKTIRVLNSHINSPNPRNYCAFRLLYELVTYQSKYISDLHVDKILPNIEKVDILVFLVKRNVLFSASKQIVFE